MNKLEQFFNQILSGDNITLEQAEALIDYDLDQLCIYADKLRAHYCNSSFDICTIVNGKSGKCSEDCKYCAQSAHFKVGVNEYPLLTSEQFISDANKNKDAGILRYSIVTSGRSLSNEDIEIICKSYVKIKKDVGISLCASHGLLTYEQLKRLKDSGVERYHNNLETSRNFFPNICTSHSYDEKIATIKSAQQAGLVVCSGGIIGLGESFSDRISMAFTLRDLRITSIPINRFTPIKGTPLGNVPLISESEFIRAVALFRFINPKATVRIAAGRGTMTDKGKKLFKSGANAAISGDMLTTSGISTKDDIDMLIGMGYRIEKL